MKGYEGRCRATPSTEYDKGQWSHSCTLHYWQQRLYRHTPGHTYDTMEEAVEAEFSRLETMVKVEIRPALPRLETLKQATSHRYKKTG
ncbi:hypothetical protein [Nibribacter koreensis]|uniref:hypothetical protein n=1 Tax=Nibribacter koreensis TaxID=1084519 RepID=UPI0031F193BD